MSAPSSKINISTRIDIFVLLLCELVMTKWEDQWFLVALLSCFVCTTGIVFLLGYIYDLFFYSCVCVGLYHPETWLLNLLPWWNSHLACWVCRLLCVIILACEYARQSSLFNVFLRSCTQSSAIFSFFNNIVAFYVRFNIVSCAANTWKNVNICLKIHFWTSGSLHRMYKH